MWTPAGVSQEIVDVVRYEASRVRRFTGVGLEGQKGRSSQRYVSPYRSYFRAVREYLSRSQSGGLPKYSFVPVRTCTYLYVPVPALVPRRRRDSTCVAELYKLPVILQPSSTITAPPHSHTERECCHFLLKRNTAMATTAS